MEIRAVIPVKGLTDPKSRLSGVLTLQKRQQLAILMLSHVISICKAAKNFASTTVISSDKQVLDFAKNKGVLSVLEKTQGLNAALSSYIKKIAAADRLVLAVIASDLPYINKEDLLTLYEKQKSVDFVLAAAKDGGTNALVIKPPYQIPFQYGINSSNKYIAFAEKNHMTHQIYSSKTIKMDIDTPEDLRILTLLPGYHSFKNVNK